MPPNDTSTRPDTFPVVAIGASAGGLDALLSFFRHMPSGTGMAFIVVLHLSPRHESSLAEVLAGVTGMTVEQVNAATTIERDHVYVIAPNRELSVHDDVLDLAVPSRKSGHILAVDLLFRTLALARGPHAVAIVLSGTGADGAVGIRSIKEHGGVTLAQAPEDAEHDNMPRNAIGTGAVDFVLPVGDMPQRLLQLWQNMQQIVLPPSGDGPTPGAYTAREPTQGGHDEALRDILILLRARTGHDFAQYKRATVLRRIERRLQVNQLRDLPTYYAYLHDHPAETRALLKDMLIGVTNFFRDQGAFDALETEVVPKLFGTAEPGEPIRVWVAGCATGEEAYSAAMLLCERSEEQSRPREIQVFATDIDEEAIAIARGGLYPAAIAADLTPERLRRFFVREGDGYRVQKSLRERVMFAVHNVLRDPPFSRLDLVVCRNLLIYFNRDIQRRVLATFHFALRRGGFLFLGSSESVDDVDGFASVDKGHRIFRTERPARAAAVLAPLVTDASRHSVSPVFTDLPHPRRSSGLTALHQALLERYGPPSVVVNGQYDIVHVSDSAGRFLRFAAGEPSLNVLKTVDPALRLDLRAALYQAMESGATTYARVLVPGAEPPRDVSITVHPVREGDTGERFALVLFDEQAGERGQPDSTAGGDASRPLLEQLEAELASTRDQLRTTIEQYETQNEELKAGNEELQAINEELRSATEELETSKEELQSINEELTTVNQELKNKIDETTSINNDLQNFIASTEIVVLFVDRSLRLMRFTPPAREIFNVLGNDLGRPLLDLTHRLAYPELESDLQQVFETLRVAEREVRSSAGRWYIARTLPYRTLDDRIEGAVMTLIDITARKETEERLRRSEEWMRFVVESVKDYAIFTMDRDGCVNTWNTGAQRLFGFAPNDIIGRYGELIFTPEDRAAGAAQEEMRQARTQGRALDERWHMRKDGTRFYCSGIMAPLVDAELYGYVKIARDMTEQRLAAEQREQAIAEEQGRQTLREEAIEQKDEFLAVLSHELRNPLNLILMQAQVLLRSGRLEDPKVAHGAALIQQTAATSARMVEDLLDASRIMTGKLALRQQLVPLSFLVGDSVGAVSQMAEEKNITLELDLAVEPLVVEADPVRVRQIAWNLLHNAIKFTPKGGKVTVRLGRTDAHARLDVVDTGMGIEPDALPTMFQFFAQRQRRGAAREEGLGIGLALVHQLVELHQGRMEVQSEGVGRGSRFSVWLPLSTPASLTPDLRTVSAVVAAPPRGSVAGLRILVVDDGADAVDALRELLALEGARVEAATSGEAALALAQEQTFDVIVSDLAMPGMDGMTLLQKVRATPSNAATPAIACSGYNRPADVQASLAAGFSAHLSKPISLQDLVKKITEVVRPRGGRMPEMGSG